MQQNTNNDDNLKNSAANVAKIYRLWERDPQEPLQIESCLEEQIGLPEISARIPLDQNFMTSHKKSKSSSSIENISGTFENSFEMINEPKNQQDWTINFLHMIRPGKAQRSRTRFLKFDKIDIKSELGASG